jgi:hypothetical protein
VSKIRGRTPETLNVEDVALDVLLDVRYITPAPLIGGAGYSAFERTRSKQGHGTRVRVWTVSPVRVPVSR